ncbi:MAG: ABC transporter ATP-binding protein/permease [Xanthobacteraceae bacterium]|nr:ABC transporter ATP-binding protein/permease [Xanthobacteraceae bacterium]
MKNLGSTLATVWRIAAPYFRSEDRWAGLALLGIVVTIELGIVAIDVLLNQWRNRFYNSLQEHNWDNFVYELKYFSVIAAIFIGIAVYQLYLNQWLQIRWRTWMTRRYLGEWLDDANHYRMQLLGDAADNPDQRIAEDIRLFVEQTLSIGIGFLNSVVTLVSFVIILWGLSAAAPLHVFGIQYDIPGYLVWGALIYAVLGTILTHLIGRPLIGLDFRQQQYEAEFRFNLVRARENAEQIALLHGEAAERGRLLDRFRDVIGNWMGIMVRTKKVTAFTAGYGQASVIFPYILVAPAYFAQKVQLGGLMQTAAAFSSVQGALSFFVTAYRQLAMWRSIVMRLEGFEAAIANARSYRERTDIIRVKPSSGTDISLRDLLLQLPDGAPLMNADGFTLRDGERTLLKGPSGAGKSTLFRAIAGIWPFGRGTIDVPANATLMMLPQRPYFPVGKLGDAIIYPSEAGTFDRDSVGATLAAVGLPALAGRLDEDAHWNRMLSLGEQQRLGIARALLHKPDYLFLDEATASLDEPAEAKLYRLLDDRLPDTTIVSIGHRNTLSTFHQREVVLEPTGATPETYAIEDAEKILR